MHKRHTQWIIAKEGFDDALNHRPESRRHH
jgi:hypothetical protein